MARSTAALVAAAALAVSANAGAYCRTTTCNPANASEACQVSNGCVVTGRPLYWASSCLSIGVRGDGAPIHDISRALAEQTLERALQTWTSALCAGGNPLLEYRLLDASQAGQDSANTLAFLNHEWPYAGRANAVAVTWLRFDVDTGEILGADIEVNGSDEPLSVGEPVRGVDLESVLTHELGHFLGLGHTNVPGATMSADYQPGSTDVRSLEVDDVSAICAVYDPELPALSTSCQSSRRGRAHPPKGGCAVALGPLTSGAAVLTSAGVLAVAGVLRLRLRRRRSAAAQRE